MKKDFLSSVFCAICAVSCVACVRYSYEMQSAHTITEEAALKQLAGMQEDIDDKDTEDTPRIPVILSEDSSFWYDQDGEGMTPEAAEEFLNGHYGYCRDILQLNSNSYYLSAWQGEKRLDKLDELYQSFVASKSDTAHDETNYFVASDEICQNVATSVLNDPPNTEIFSEMAERLPYNLASADIGELIISIRKRELVYEDGATDYIFWSTAAQLINDEVYSVDKINQSTKSRELKKSTSQRASTQEVGPTSTPEEPSNEPPGTSSASGAHNAVLETNDPLAQQNAGEGSTMLPDPRENDRSFNRNQE